MRIEIHVLQNFAPSNLNRDDTGSPKAAEFGGYRRARISSQCQKRVVRDYFDDHEDLIPAANRAIRTKRLLEYVRPQLAKEGRDTAAIDRAIACALAAAKLKLDSKRQELTQYLLFLGKNEIAAFAAVVEKHFDSLAKEHQKAEDPPTGERRRRTARQQKSDAREAVPEEVQRTVPALLDGGKAADVLRFLAGCSRTCPTKTSMLPARLRMPSPQTKFTPWQWTITPPWTKSTTTILGPT